MRLVLHEYFWLIRRVRTWLIGYTLLWAAFTGLAFLVPRDDMSRNTSVEWCYGLAILGILGLLIAMGTIGMHRASGTDLPWRTRPLPWWRVLAARLLFNFTVIPAAPALAWAVIGFHLDQTAMQWAAGAGDFLIAGLIISGVTGLRSLAEGWIFSGVLLVLVAILIQGGAFALEEAPRAWRFVNSLVPMTSTTPDWLNRQESIAFFLPSVTALALLWLWAQGLRRRITPWRAVAAGTIIVMGPALGRIISGAFPGSGATPENRDLDLRAEFPAGTRWYKFLSSGWGFHDLPSRFRVLTRSITLPIAAGTSGAGKGFRLEIAEVKADDRNLELSLHWQLTSSEVWPGWIRDEKLGIDKTLLVVHLPQASTACAGASTTKGQLRNLRYAAGIQRLYIPLPDTEAALGRTWEDLLRGGGELVLMTWE